MHSEQGVTTTFPSTGEPRVDRVLSQDDLDLQRPGRADARQGIQEACRQIDRIVREGGPEWAHLAALGALLEWYRRLAAIDRAAEGHVP
jgi:hypothetical protein